MKKIHRFIISQPLPVHGGAFELSDRSLAHQITRVLKLLPGETIIVCDGQGNEALGNIIESTPSSVRLDLQPPRPVMSEPKLRLHLYAALIRPELFELIVQKTTELGVASIAPLITERTVRTGFKHTRLETIAKEAAELAGRGIIPVIHEPVELAKLLIPSFDRAVWVVADQGGGELSSLLKNRTEVSLLIGPEGGWTDRERQSFQRSSIPAIGLGPTVLRAETAAIAGCFACLNAVR